MFLAVAFDKDSATIELQHFDADIAEISLIRWRSVELELPDAPEDWTGPMDNIEPDDLGDSSETEMSSEDWRAPLQEVRRDESEPWESSNEDTLKQLVFDAGPRHFTARLPASQELVKMRSHISIFLLLTVAFLGTSAAANAETLSGKNNGMTREFSVNGPWAMDWRARSEFPLLASIEMRLHDGDTGEFLGMIAEIKGTGAGLKVFEDGGTYQVVIVGTFVEWDLVIEEMSEEQAASLIRHAAATPTLSDTVERVSRLVPESSFSSWRPKGNENLILFDDDSISWSVSFSPACPGLQDATAISFVMTTNDTGHPGQYDSILLDNGTRYYFTKVVPNVVR